jgi:hypothetical protein
VLSTNPTDFRSFVTKVEKATRKKSPATFDKWLKRAKEHGFLDLINGTDFKGVEREEAKRQAAQMYEILLWTAYMLMARCYGVLMLRVYLDFCLHNNEPPTPEEKVRFRQMHFPQGYLSGLPLAFFGRAQLRWIMGALVPLWNSYAADPEEYDLVTELLGISGLVAQERRTADVREKRMKKIEEEEEICRKWGSTTSTTRRHKAPKGSSDDGRDIMEVDEAPTNEPPVQCDNDMDAPPEVVPFSPGARQCEKCNSMMQYTKPLSATRSKAIVQLDCNECGTQKLLSVDLI